MMFIFNFIFFSFILSPIAWAGHGGIYQRMGYEDLNQRLTINIDYPLLSGIDFNIPWVLVEPEEGKFNWGVIDKIIEPWQKAGKKVVFTIIALNPRGQSPYAGHSIPSWVFKKGAKKITIKERKTMDGTADYPLFWDEVYLREYEKFIKEVAKRYDGHPAIDVIGIGIAKLGALTVIDEKVEEGEREKLKDFYMQNGFSFDKWAGTIKKIASMYDANFNKTPVRLTLSAFFEKGKENEETLSFLEDLAAWAVSQKIHLFHQAVTNKIEKVSSINKLFNKYCGQTVLGAELVNPIYGTGKGNRKLMGDIMTAVKNALGEGAAGPPSCISYLNLYVPDITASNPNSSSYNQEWGKAVEYASSHLRKISGTTQEVLKTGSSSPTTPSPSTSGTPQTTLEPKGTETNQELWQKLREQVTSVKESVKARDIGEIKSEILGIKNTLSKIRAENPEQSGKISEAMASLDETIRLIESGNRREAKKSFKNALNIIQSIGKDIN